MSVAAWKTDEASPGCYSFQHFARDFQMKPTKVACSAPAADKWRSFPAEIVRQRWEAGGCGHSRGAQPGMGTQNIAQFRACGNAILSSSAAHSWRLPQRDTFCL